MPITEHAFSSWILLRGISFVYVVAFLSLSSELLGLFGKNGLLSIDTLLGIIEKQSGLERFWQMPSLFWLTSEDISLYIFCLLGLLASSFALMGFATGWMLLVCWLIYLSICSTGQDFMSYQWDSLLLETGFVCLFIANWNFEFQLFTISEPDPIAKGLIYFLAFKLILQSGIVKLTSKDLSWRNLTALKFHFWTQPLPNHFAIILSQLHDLVLRAFTFLVLLIELGLPAFIFATDTIRTGVAVLVIVFQVLLFLTGNFAFFNLLTAAIFAFLIPDSWYLTFFKLSPEIFAFVKFDNSKVLFAVALSSLAAIHLALNVFWFVHIFNLPAKGTRFLLPLVRLMYPFKICNSYGLFAVMTKQRFELILQGSVDGVNWQTYQFKSKPTSAQSWPTQIAPLHPRFDWQLWFCSLADFEQSPWLNNLIARIFWQSEDVLSLFKTNPFANQEVLHLRFQKLELRPNGILEILKTKTWYHEISRQNFGPIFSNTDLPVVSDSEQSKVTE